MAIPIIVLLLLASYFTIEIKLATGLHRLKKCHNNKNYRVSIIVAMRNEEKRATQCLKGLVHQQYPDDLLEIIIVDDGSTDATPEIVKEFQTRHPVVNYLKINNPPHHQGNKKLALMKGIEVSSGEILFFTDADCVPPPNWVRSIISCFGDDVGIVVGFSPLIGLTNMLIDKIIRLDSLAAGLVAAGSIGLEKAVTCAGRNLAYRRIVFRQINGFTDILHSISGDDDLFLQLAHYRTNWKIKHVIGRDCVVPAFHQQNLKQFINQKKRHLSAGKYYNFKIQIGYFLYHLANLSLFVFFFLSLFLTNWLAVSSGLLLAKLFADWFLLKNGAKKFYQQFDVSAFLGWEILFLGYHLFVAPAAWFGKIRWK